MKTDARPPDPDLDALLERARVIPPVSDVVRARAVARARATAAAASTLAPEYALAGRTGRPSLAVAASIALFALIAGGATAALFHRAPDPPASPRPPSPSDARALPRVPVAAADQGALPLVVPQPVAPAKTRRPAHLALLQESYAAELDLLRRAQAAYAGRNFSDALVLVAEHGRRFPNGRLAEEREALRVRSLASSGRRGEAQSAFEGFANRFPRSVLLLRLREAVGTAFVLTPQ